MQSLRITNLYSALITGFFILCPLTSFADYAVAPLVIDLELEARDIITKTITVTNSGTQQVTIYPTVNNISRNEAGTIEEFLSPAESDRTQSLSSWIEISRRGIDLNPGETSDFEVTFRVHPEPQPGTYHAFIGFGNGRNRDEAEIQVKNGVAPGTIITATIEEKTVEILKLSRFIIDRFVTNANNQAAVYTFKNPGDEVLVPKGEIIFYDSTGKEVGMTVVNTENISIAPGTEYSFVSTVPTQGLFGKYKAFLTVEYGSTQRSTVNDTSFFYVFPYKIILSILGVLVLVVGFFAWYFHRRYFDGDEDDSDRLTFRIRDSASESKHHDIDLKKV